MRSTFGKKLVKRNSYPIDKPSDFWRSIGSSGIGGSTMTRAGVAMNAFDALAVSANVNCISVIGRSMAAIPCNVWKTRPSGRGGGRDIADDYPTNRVLNGQANREMTAYQWQLSRVWNRATYGGTYDVIDWNRLGEATALWPSLTPNVEPFQLRNLSQLNEYDDVSEAGDTAYRITKTFPEYRQDVLPRSRVLSIPGQVTLNGIIGLPAYQMMRQQLGAAKSLAQWQDGFFGDGYSPAFIAKLTDDPGTIKRLDIVEKTKEEFAGWKSSHGLWVVPGGAEITNSEYRLDYAMLAERNREAYENICGFWGVPVMLTGKSWGSTFTNSVEFWQHYIKNCLLPWATNDVQAFNSYLFNDAQRDAGYHTAYDFTALEKMDAKAWAEKTKVMWQAGAIKPDEIREDNQKNPLENGVGQDTYMQMQMKELGSDPVEPQGGGEDD